MDRRSALKTTTLMLGYAVSATTTAAILGGCKADPDPLWTPAFMDMDQAKTIDKITSLIIPTTDTPGATEAMVGRYMDGMLKNYADEEERKLFTEFMTSFATKCTDEHGKLFHKLDEETQLGIVKGMLDEENEAMMKIREMTIAGYCTSEAGATNLLVYDPIPGAQKGCIPFEEVGGIWAL